MNAETAREAWRALGFHMAIKNLDKKAEEFVRQKSASTHIRIEKSAALW
jgi:hypothetical protein